MENYKDLGLKNVDMDYRELRGLVNKTHDRFSEINFDESLSLLQKVNLLAEHFKTVLVDFQSLVDYMNWFVENFDSKLYNTLDDVLNDWVNDGKLQPILEEIFGKPFWEWFNELKEIVGDEPLGNILLTILEIQEKIGTLEDFRSQDKNIIDKTKNEFSERIHNILWYKYDYTEEIDDVCDIPTPDTPYWNKILKRAKKYTNEIYFPSGVYRFKGGIEFDDTFKIFGSKVIRRDNKYVDGTIFIFELNESDKQAFMITPNGRQSQFKDFAVVLDKEKSNSDNIANGIATQSENKDLYSSHLNLDNIHVNGFYGGSGFDLPQIFLGTIKNCISQYNKIGFNFKGFSTSLVLERNYAMSNSEMGFFFGDITYSVFNVLASDGNMIGYKFDEVYGVTANSLGAERNNDTGILITGKAKGLTLNSPTSINNGRYDVLNRGSFIHIQENAQGIVINTPNNSRDDESVSRKNVIYIESRVTGSLNYGALKVFDEAKQESINNNSPYFSINGIKSGFSKPTHKSRENDFIANRDIKSNEWLLGWVSLGTGVWREVYTGTQTFGELNIPSDLTGYIKYTKEQTFRTITLSFRISLKGLKDKNKTIIDVLPDNLKYLDTTSTVIASNLSDPSLNGYFIITDQNKIIFRSDTTVPENHTYQGSFTISIRY